MDNKLCAILGEKDLEIYDKHLKAMQKPVYQNFQKGIMANYLTTHKGKLVKVELMSKDCNRPKTGTLLDVGEDYIVLKIGNSCVSTVIPTDRIKCISFVHNNDKRMIDKF